MCLFLLVHVKHFPKSGAFFFFFFLLDLWFCFSCLFLLAQVKHFSKTFFQNIFRKRCAAYLKFDGGGDDDDNDDGGGGGGGDSCFFVHYV